MNMKLKTKMKMKKKRGGQFFSTTGTAFPKYRRSSSFSFLQVPVEAKKNNKQTTEEEEEQKNKRTKNKKQNCFVAQRVLELLQTSFSKLS